MSLTHAAFQRNGRRLFDPGAPVATMPSGSFLSVTPLTAAVLAAAAALVTGLFVSDKRTSGSIVPRAPDAGCAKPVRTQEVTS
jgi:hypothetical protein